MDAEGIQKNAIVADQTKPELAQKENKAPVFAAVAKTTNVHARRSVFRILGARCVGFIDQLGHFNAAASRCVMHEMQLRQSMDGQAVTELATYVAGCGSQARYRILDLVLVITKHREKYFGVRIASTLAVLSCLISRSAA